MRRDKHHGTLPQDRTVRRLVEALDGAVIVKFQDQSPRATAKMKRARV
jgi:hypothetical protein